MAAFRTDARVKGSLNAGLLPSAGSTRAGVGGGGQGGGPGGSGAREAEPSSEEYLDRFEEELHKKVDAEIEGLVNGLEECVALTKVGFSGRGWRAGEGARETNPLSLVVPWSSSFGPGSPSTLKCDTGC